MKRVISLFISLTILISIIACVDLSSYASEDIPSYKNFQAQCYSMDDVYGVFEVDTYNHVFAEAFKNNSDFQESVAAWEITNQILDPSSIAGTQIDKIQYYELMLFDVIDSASKNTNLLKYLTDRYESYIISATKKITEAIPESDYSTYFYDTLSVSTAEKITNIINKTPEMMDALKNAQDILKTAKTGVDYILNLARYQITYDLSDYEIEVLRTIKSNTNNAYLRAAVDEVIAYQENILTETLVEAIHVTEFTVEIIFNVAVGALWSAICQPIACLNLVYKGTKAAVDAWLATDDIIQAYYSIAALDEFETALKSSMDSLRSNYLSNPTDENAELFMASVGLYERSVVTGCNYVESVLDAQYKKAAWGIIFKSENEMNDRYQQLQTYKTTVVNSFNSIEESCKSIYLKKYYTDYNDLLGIYNKETKVIPITGLSCDDNNLTIAVNEDYFVTASYTPSNTTETQLKYSNSNDKVISIGDFGQIRGLSEGTSTITIYSAVDNSVRDTMTVTVSGYYDLLTGNTTYTDKDGNETVITDAHYKDYTYSVSNGTATITQYTGSASTVYVPSTLGGYPVTTIGNSAFKDCNISQILFPRSITSIDSYAFQNCVKLTSIDLPDNLISMGGLVFDGCTRLKEILIPRYVTTMYGYLYVGGWKDISSLKGSGIERVVFESGITSIPYHACWQNTSLKEVVIPNSVTSIKDGAFEGCTSLKGIDIPNSVTSLGNSVFSNCTNITADGLIMPDSIKNIGSYAFQNCTSLTNLYLSKSLNTLSSYIFSGCTNLEKIDIPRSITSIDSYAFQNCVKLTSIDLPDNLISMGGLVFDGCTRLKEILIPRYVTTMYGYLYVGGWKDISSLKGSGIERVVFESGITSIPYHACWQNTSLKEVVIPNSVTSIKDGAFEGCTGEVIYGYANSYAQTYANKNNIEFMELECNHSNKIIKYAYSASTCDNGYTGDTYCANCGLLLSEGKSIPATGHLYELVVENNPTCTDAGSRKYVCSVCSNSYTEYLPATNHTFISKIQSATCQSSGYTMYTCSVCGYSYKANYTALGEHNYIDSVTRIANCMQSGKITHTCNVCGDSYVEIIPMTEHSYESVVVSPTPNKKGYTKHICSVCGDSYIDNYTDFIKDTDALAAAIEKFSEFNSADYSETSYNNLKDVVNRNKELLDTAQSQEEIDFAVTEILEVIYDLEPYLNFTVSAENGSYEVTCDESTTSNNKYSLLFGTEITLSATANEGYEFVGWYDVINNRYFSKESTYTFKLTENINLKAVFVKEQSATLIFTTYSNWVQSTVTKTIDEWNSVTSIDDLLPQVPYKYGYSNGRWVYDNDDVLARLQTGENVSLIPEYDEDDTSLPTPRDPVNGVPALDLYYKLDADANVGSFVMAAGIPDDCQIESVGVAFYYKKANEFDPTKFELLINNKMLVSRFNTKEIEDIYIVNMNKLTSTYNWAVRGYVTYYDTDGNLKTAYSNQVNIVNREQV